MAPGLTHPLQTASPTSTSLDGEALRAHGEHLLTTRRLPEALEALTRAEAAGADPDRCAGARWHCWMLLGNMRQAWLESDAIHARQNTSRFWDGSDPTGKRVIVRSLHGFGDAVQNLRFLPALRLRASHVTLEIAPELWELARYACGVDEVITWGAGAPTTSPVYDLQIEITELPYLLRCGAEDLAATTPYLQLPPDLHTRHLLATVTPQVPRVGIAWSSSQWDPSRSVPFRLLDSLLQTSGVEFWSLQTATDNIEWRRFHQEHGWPARAAAEGSVLDTALALTELDLVLSVDTFVAHLAGALGRPVWLLLKHDADWRWGIDRRDSPWYPTMRLFRQAHPGDWTPVLDEVRHCLNRWSSHLE